MAAGFAKAGNQLYTGERAYPFIQKSTLWFGLAGLIVLISVAIPFLRGGFNLGIEFTGGSEFTVSQTEDADISIGEDVVSEITDQEATVTNVGPGTVRVQTEELSDTETLEVAEGLAEGYGVSSDQVSSTFIGPVWGEHISEQMLLGLVIFVVLVALYMAFYFRTWKMSLAAMAGLGFVVVTTVGVYAATDFEVTPSAIIGFLTILSYALYDTMVVFDKIRENLDPLERQHDQTFTERTNLAVNQTLVRSVNTSVVGILPVGSILFIGSWLLGAGTLRDIALSLFVGIIVGTVATIFVQAPLYALIRRGDFVEHTREVLALRQERFQLAGMTPEITASGTPLQDGRPVAFPPLPEPEQEEKEQEEEDHWQLVIQSSDPAAVPVEAVSPEEPGEAPGTGSPRESS